MIRLPDGKLEPLFGLYSRTLLGGCENAIKTGGRRMTEVLYNADTRFVNPGELGDLWDERLILNINYPEDLDKILLRSAEREESEILINARPGNDK